jgi:SulP family sulfate permease
MWNKLFPPLQWLREYSSESLKSDIIAGIALAAYAIPLFYPIVHLCPF